MLVGCALYVEALKPISLLSLVLQCEKTDIVSSIESTLKSVNSLESLIQKDPKEWTQLKFLEQHIQ